MIFKTFIPKTNLFISLSLSGILWLCAVVTQAQEEPYRPGREYCADIAQHERGAWVRVPTNYKLPKSNQTEIYYYFIQKQFDPKKPTVVFVDGGPGSTSHNYDRWFELLHQAGFNIVFFDQRGYICSRPPKESSFNDRGFYSIENSAQDMEKIREQLGIKKWSVYGHSYGATVALQYAQFYPQSVTSLVLMGPAFTTKEDPLNEARVVRGLVASALKGLSASAKEAVIRLTNQTIDAQEWSEFSFDYIQRVKEFSSAFGINGIDHLNQLVETHHRQPRGINEKIDDLIDRLFAELAIKNKRQFQLGFDAEPFDSDPESSEIITDELWIARAPVNKFRFNESGEVIFEIDNINVDSKDAGNAYFDVARLTVNVPTYIFHGALDGTPTEEPAKILFSVNPSVPRILIEFLQNGHGISYEVLGFSTNTQQPQLLVRMFAQALSAQEITVKHLSDFNQAGFFSARFHKP